MTTFNTMDPTKLITEGARGADTCSVTATVERAEAAGSEALVAAGSRLSAEAAAEDAEAAGSDLVGAWLGVAVVVDVPVDTVL
jgi:hypothetical protein